jgi:GNAT superfamily N-acetyltransferase
MRIRAALADDYQAFARLFPELGPEFPVPPQTAWANMASDSIVAEAGGAVVGYALGTTFGTLGHLSQLVVEPQHRRSGIARRLLFEAGDRLRAAGCDRWQLNVKRNNVAAYTLYERVGFTYASTCAWITIEPSGVASLPRGGEFTARPLDPALDTAAEAWFGLRSGELAWCRSLGTSLVHEVVDAADEPVGLGVFVTGTRFVTPLRVREVRALAPLIASFPEPGLKIRLAVEDAALRDALLRCGGTVELETDRLVAPL